MYHGFSRPTNKNDGLTNFEGKHKNIAEFEKHLKLFTKYCTPVSLEDIASNRKLPPNPVVLTFDDGYQNNYAYAYPLLKKYRVPATIFVTSGFVDKTNFLWTDRLEYIVDHTAQKNIEISWENEKLVFNMNAFNEKTDTLLTIKKYLKNLPETKKQLFIDRIQEAFEVEYNWDTVPTLLQPLNWDEIREMRQSGLVSIGAHTVTHPILSKCTYEEQREELTRSQRRIADELGEECTLFAYPNGQMTDYNQDTIGLLKELGFLCAVTTIFGYLDNNHRDDLQLNRFGVAGSLEELGTIATGLSRLVGKI